MTKQIRSSVREEGDKMQLIVLGWLAVAEFTRGQRSSYHHAGD